VGGVFLVSVETERSNSTLVIRFVRPEVRNPLSIEVLERLDEIIEQARSSSAVTKIVFTGTDRIFASGADLREVAAVTPDSARSFAERGQKLMSKIAGVPQITVAAINGYCFGGALDLALACDRRIASPEARFAHPGAGLGIITGWGGTQRLPRLVGTANALEIFFTAAPLDARRALRIGLVDEIAADPLDDALKVVG
jgi:enoyl-CoA hydratase/carnithine racemase